MRKKGGFFKLSVDNLSGLTQFANLSQKEAVETYFQGAATTDKFLVWSKETGYCLSPYPQNAKPFPDGMRIEMTLDENNCSVLRTVVNVRHGENTSDIHVNDGHILTVMTTFGEVIKLIQNDLKVLLSLK